MNKENVPAENAFVKLKKQRIGIVILKFFKLLQIEKSIFKVTALIINEKLLNFVFLSLCITTVKIYTFFNNYQRKGEQGIEFKNIKNTKKNLSQLADCS